MTEAVAISYLNARTNCPSEKFNEEDQYEEVRRNRLRLTAATKNLSLAKFHPKCHELMFTPPDLPDNVQPTMSSTVLRQSALSRDKWSAKGVTHPVLKLYNSWRLQVHPIAPRLFLNKLLTSRGFCIDSLPIHRR